MNSAECRALIDAYVTWLKAGLAVEDVGETCELTTPFLDRHNDHLQIYATHAKSGVELSDDGYVLADLRMSGMEFTTPKRKDFLDAALRGFGVQLRGDRMVVDASKTNMGQRLHSLVQAMLAVNDMFVMAQPHVATLFFEDVELFLSRHQIRYTDRVKVTGKTGFDHAIDFLIPRSQQRPDRFVQALNRPTRNNVGTCLFAFNDIREARQNGAETYAFLNDREQPVGGDVTDAFDAYSVTSVRWSQREQYVDALRG